MSFYRTKARSMLQTIKGEGKYNKTLAELLVKMYTKYCNGNVAGPQFEGPVMLPLQYLVSLYSPQFFESMKMVELK